MAHQQLGSTEACDSANSLDHLRLRKVSNSSFLSNVVDFEGKDDKDDPLNWSRTYKWSLVCVMSFLSLSVNIAIMTAAPAVPAITKEFHVTSNLQSTLVISIWELGEAIGPLFLAPLSEFYGRVPVYHAANTAFVLMAIGAAMSTSIQMLITFRFLLGASVCTQALNGSIIGDIFEPEHRGRALAFLGILPYISACIGPAVGGVISDRLGWRWTFWITAMATGALELVWAGIFRETYRVVLVERKTKRLQSIFQTSKFYNRYSSDSDKWQNFRSSLARPLQLLFTSKVTFLLSVCGGVAMGYLYIVITSLTEIFSTVYRFPDSEIGLSFLGLGVGMFSGIVASGIFLDWYLQRQQARGKASPEVRLPPLILGFILVPISLLCIGWLVECKIHWMATIVATSLTGAGFAGVTLSSSSYLVDAFGIYAASASAAVQTLRCALSAVLPLAAPALASKLGYGSGYSVLAAVALVLSPIPVVIMRFGQRMRGRFEGLCQV